MNKYLFSLIIALHFFVSCKGQNKTEKSIETVVDRQSFTSKNSKLTKTQGSDKYQNVHCSLEDKDGNLWLQRSPSVSIPSFGL